MSNDAISKVLYDFMLTVVHRPEGYNTKPQIEEAAQQIHEYIDREIIGEDEPVTKDLEEKIYIIPSRNILRREQRRKLG